MWTVISLPISGYYISSTKLQLFVPQTSLMLLGVNKTSNNFSFSSPHANFTMSLLPVYKFRVSQISNFPSHRRKLSFILAVVQTKQHCNVIIDQVTCSTEFRNFDWKTCNNWNAGRFYYKKVFLASSSGNQQTVVYILFSLFVLRALPTPFSTHSS